MASKKNDKKIFSIFLENLKYILYLLGKPFFLLFFFLITSLYKLIFLIKKVVYILGDISNYFKPLIKRVKKTKIFIPRLPLVFLLILLLFFQTLSFLSSLPSPKKLRERKIEQSSKIYDRNGILLYKIYKDKDRTYVKINEIPLVMQLATIAAEDAEFYLHSGISIKGIIRSFISIIKTKKISGGSTITQQLVKNTLLTPQRTLSRKIKEIILATIVEMMYSKDEILEMYLNEVSYGGTAYGIKEAAKLYFDKELKDLTIAEAAYLAGLPKSPTNYSFFGNTPEKGLARQKEVIKLMYINKFITKEQQEEALKEELKFSDKKVEIKAPHFVMFTKENLENKVDSNTLFTGGLEIYTTLDYQIQKLTEEAIKQELQKLERLNVKNASALVIDTKTGEILAMVGSKDYFDIQNQGNVNVSLRARQPGSAIKVINYAYALSNGYTPATIIDDSPVTFYLPGQKPYSPKNYDGKYRGKISLRSALAESRNIPAVKVLASYGVEKMIELGKKMGITTWEDKNRFGLSLTLGGGEVKLIDLAKVYLTIANYGKKKDLVFVKKIVNDKGKKISDEICFESENCNKKEEKIIDERVAFLLIDILKDNEARTPAFGRNSQLLIPDHPEVAVKTGTSNNLRDNLTIGFNQDYLVAVWVGNNDNSPMARIASGLTGASSIFNRIMRILLYQKPAKDWDIPQGLVKREVCTITGTLPCEGCPTKTEWFLKENEPKTSCNLKLLKSKKIPNTNNEKILPEAWGTSN